MITAGYGVAVEEVEAVDHEAAVLKLLLEEESDDEADDDEVEARVDSSLMLIAMEAHIGIFEELFEIL